MLEIDLDDDGMAAHADPTWANRPSLFETQLKDALELGYQIAFHRAVKNTTQGKKSRQTETLPEIVTRAIAAAVPIDEVSNVELATILLSAEYAKDLKSTVRHFRNAERPLKSSTANRYIKDLIHSKKMVPADGGRLWYLVLIYAAGMHVVAELFRQNVYVDQDTFEADLNSLVATASKQFDYVLETSLKTSSKLDLGGSQKNDVSQFMDYCSFVNWQESKVKRNPMASIKRLIDLVPVFNDYTFDE